MAKRKPVPPKPSKPQAPQAKPAARWPRVALLPVLAAVAVYANSLANGFAADDKEQLLQNPLVSGHQVAAAFGSGVWAFRGAHGNYYRPLQFLIYMAIHAGAGFQAPVFHLLFVLMHAVNTALVYALTQRITARPRAALAAALLFALHPIHTEVVDWIASLPDLLLTTIAIAGVWWFVRQDGRPRGRQIAGHCALYLAALGLKETGVMLLPLYLGCEWMLLGRRPAELRKNAGLYAAMSTTLAVYLAARWNALGGLAPGQESFHHLTAVEFGLSAVVIAGQYLGRLFLPGDLNFFHIFHATAGIGAAFCIALAALAALAVAAWRRGTPAAARFGIVWMALTLAPALNLTGVGQNVFAERYLYLPSVGFCWIVGMAWAWCADRRLQASAAAGLVILCACAWQTMTRNRDWRDDLTLFGKTAAQSPAAGVIHNNLAGALIDHNQFDRALDEERLAVRYEPLAEPFHKNLGMLLMLHNPREAAKEFEEALRLQPSDQTVRGLLQEAQAAGR